MSKSKRLTLRQKTFIREYLISGNATQAAISAGYSPRSARKYGSQLLDISRLKRVLEMQQAKIAQSAGIRREEVLAVLIIIVRTSRDTFATWGKNGVVLKNSNEIALDKMGALSELAIAKGKFGSAVKIKLKDKLKAIELLAKLLGWNEDSKLPHLNRDNDTEHILQAIQKLRNVTPAE